MGHDTHVIRYIGMVKK